ncbi:unnamed protein product [Closterium sp. NIES-64]|nr:unnamed protein product [Closterium sp. NIES-64]
MTALDAVDDNNMYGIAFLAGGAYGTDIYYDVEYLDEAYEEEGGLRRIIINLEVHQRFFKGAPPKKQPITPLSSTSFVMEDAELFADHTMTNRLAVGTHLRTDAHWHELFCTLSYWAASPNKGLLFQGRTREFDSH